MVAAVKELGEELRELRLERDLTLRQLAAAVGGEISWQGVSRLERGERQPTLRSLELLARALDARFVIEPGGTRLEPA